MAAQIKSLPQSSCGCLPCVSSISPMCLQGHWLLHNTVTILITPTKILITNKVMFTGIRFRASKYLSGGHNSVHNILCSGPLKCTTFLNAKYIHSNPSFPKVLTHSTISCKCKISLRKPRFSSKNFFDTRLH